MQYLVNEINICIFNILTYIKCFVNVANDMLRYQCSVKDMCKKEEGLHLFLVYLLTI